MIEIYLNIFEVLSGIKSTISLNNKTKLTFINNDYQSQD